MSKILIEWRDIDFRPAPFGWRAIYIVTEKLHWYAVPLAGWIVQEAQDEAVPAEDRERRFVAAVHSGGGIDLSTPDLAGYWGDFWYIDGLNENPGREEIERHCEAMSRMKERAEERRKKE